jgi:hypothetical protein
LSGRADGTLSNEDGVPTERVPFDNSSAVFIWVLLTDAILGLIGGSGLQTASLALGTAVFGISLILLALNWSTNSPAWTGRQARTRLIVLAAAAGLVLAPVLVAVLTAGENPAATGGLRHTAEAGLARAGLLSAVVATSAIYLSALVDWSYTAPRRRGKPDGHRPCTSSTDPAWRSLTSNWLRHRVISFTVARLALVVLAGVMVVAVCPPIPSKIVPILTGAAAVLVGYILSRATAVASLSQNPPLWVGDEITLAEEFGTGVKDRPTYYVVDVAVEGIQLRELKEGLPVGDSEHSHDRTLEASDVNRLLRSRTRFTGCAPECSRVNKYCPLKKGDPTPPQPGRDAASSNDERTA